MQMQDTEIRFSPERLEQVAEYIIDGAMCPICFNPLLEFRFTKANKTNVKLFCCEECFEEAETGKRFTVYAIKKYYEKSMKYCVCRFCKQTMNKKWVDFHEQSKQHFDAMVNTYMRRSVQINR